MVTGISAFLVDLLVKDLFSACRKEPGISKVKSDVNLRRLNCRISKNILHLVTLVITCVSNAHQEHQHLFLVEEINHISHAMLHWESFSLCGLQQLIAGPQHDEGLRWLDSASLLVQALLPGSCWRAHSETSQSRQLDRCWQTALKWQKQSCSPPIPVRCAAAQGCKVGNSKSWTKVSPCPCIGEWSSNCTGLIPGIHFIIHLLTAHHSNLPTMLQFASPNCSLSPHGEAHVASKQKLCRM